MCIKVIGENIGSIQAPEDYNWMFKIKCSSCQEVHEKWIILNQKETFELEKGKSTAHFIYKCKFCKRSSSLTIEKSFVYKDHDFAPFIILDCRGVEPIDYSPFVD